MVDPFGSNRSRVSKVEAIADRRLSMREKPNRIHGQNRGRLQAQAPVIRAAGPRHQVRVDRGPVRGGVHPVVACAQCDAQPELLLQFIADIEGEQKRVARPGPQPVLQSQRGFATPAQQPAVPGHQAVQRAAPLDLINRQLMRAAGKGVSAVGDPVRPRRQNRASIQRHGVLGAETANQVPSAIPQASQHRPYLGHRCRVVTCAQLVLLTGRIHDAPNSRCCPSTRPMTRTCCSRW